MPFLRWAAFLAACVSAKPPAESPVPEEPVAPVEPRLPVTGPAPDGGAAVNTFGFRLYEQLAEPDANLFFSPASVELALAMTAAGAKGETATVLQTGLSLPAEPHASLGALQGSWSLVPSEDSSVELANANRIWVQTGLPLEAPFEASMRDDYAAPVQRLDFRATGGANRAPINRWVAEATRSRIPELIPDGLIDSDTRIVLTNALYFKGAWLHPFEKTATESKPFHGPSQAVSVPTMTHTENYPYVKRDGYAAVLLPYRGNRFDMLIVLPDAREGLAAVEQHLDHAVLQEAFAQPRHTRLQVSLPKFELDQNRTLKGPLTELGMGLIFRRESDFTGMSTEDELVVSEVVHQAFVAVDEAGTEAAAATAVMMGAGSVPKEPIPFRADHPFFFAIRDRESGALLFMGRVVDPS